MLLVVLILLGLCFGSFVNALCWRLRQQQLTADSRQQLAKEGKNKKLSVIGYQLTAKDLSIWKGRSMCPHCKHTLATLDLIPVLSWLWLKGKCRYCHEPISWQYPLVEVATAALFVISYLFWPYSVSGTQNLLLFGFWLVLLVGFMALIVYDSRWMLLPDKIVYPLIGVALLQLTVQLAFFDAGFSALTAAVWGVLVIAGFFYALFQVSGGRWIGGGDVKLGVILGLVVGGPVNSLLVLFLASLLGSLVAAWLLITKKLRRNSQIAFGPFLIVATIIVYLFGAAIVSWYKNQLLLA